MRLFLSATAFFNQIAVLQCEQYHWHPYNPFHAMSKNRSRIQKKSHRVSGPLRVDMENIINLCWRRASPFYRFTTKYSKSYWTNSNLSASWVTECIKQNIFLSHEIFLIIIIIFRRHVIPQKCKIISEFDPDGSDIPHSITRWHLGLIPGPLDLAWFFHTFV